MKKLFIQINFEVLGQAFCFYSPMVDPIPFEHFEEEVKKISPTAHIVNICTTLIDEPTAKEFNFKTKISDWMNELEGRFDDSEALIELQNG